MNWVRLVRNRMHRFILNRKVLNSTQPREIVNLEEAKDIGILFDASKSEHIDIVSKYSDQLRKLNKRIELLAYHKSTKNTETLKFPFFTRKELNWYLKPQGERVSRFMSKKFDLLINANIENCAPLEYIAALSKARYRIGYYDPKSVHNYDLMISLNQEQSLNHYMDQVNYYLEIIKTK